MRWLSPFMIGLVVSLSLASLISLLLAQHEEPSGDTFEARVDLRPLDAAAVWSQGRLKSFDSYAHEVLSTIAGRNALAGHADDFAYLDLMFRPARYSGEPTVFVKKKVIRKQLASVIAQDDPGFDERSIRSADGPPMTEREHFMEAGLVRADLLFLPGASSLLDRMYRDLVRTSKAVNAIEASIRAQQPSALAAGLKLLPPLPEMPGSPDQQPWGSVSDLPSDPAVLSEYPEGSAVAAASRSWADLESAWRAEDSAGANAAIAQLAAAVRSINPDVYPSATRLAFESWYFKLANLTWVWILYLFSVVLLLMAVAYRWDGARWVGFGLFGGAFALHTAALGWRWWVSGRWPNANMFEAVTTSVWLAAAVAIAFEVIARRSPLRNLFVLSASAACMAAMMAAHYIPELDPSVNNMMPILHDLWLYIHTNVIIASYALIAMAAVTATLYLLRRCVTGSASDYARSSASTMLMAAGGGAIGSGPAVREQPSVGRRGPTLGQIFDGSTMVLVELSFLLLWAGIVMGAIWADHSWGRPWGWDPKEVFALNTFIVYIILIHVRMKARDKGLWTATLALIGAGVMLFNWIVINFVISGLHSYA